MKVTVIGTGYVGLTTGVILAELGHCVTCADNDFSKIDLLNKGVVPFYEPGMEQLFRKYLGRSLRFSNRVTSAGQSKVLIIAVGIPASRNGIPDTGGVLEVISELIPYLKKYKVIILKSTVPIGTKDLVEKFLLYKGVERRYFDIVSNPEFLRIGSAIKDSLNPDRIIIGSSSQKAAEITRSLYQRLERPIMITSNGAAEMIKYASNAFLTAKISFINEIAGICESYGVDVNEVARGMGYDYRIGPEFLNAGAGYGGACLPRDLSGLIHMAEQGKSKAAILRAVQEVNESQPAKVITKLQHLCGIIAGKKIGVWGLAFKPGTDDMRYAPSIPVINELVKKQAKVNVYDPVALKNAGKFLPPSINLCENMYEAAKDCDALIIMTEWRMFVEADLKKLKSIMKRPAIIDARNIYSPLEMKMKGFLYKGFGRYCR